MFDQLAGGSATALGRIVYVPLAAALARGLARLHVRPTAVTVAELSVGLAGAALLAAARGPWLVVGLVLLHIALLLDYADGTLARLTHAATRFGGAVDMLVDRAVFTALLVAIGVRPFASSGRTTGLLLALVAVVGDMLYHLGLLYYLDAKALAPLESAAPSPIVQAWVSLGHLVDQNEATLLAVTVLALVDPAWTLAVLVGWAAVAPTLVAFRVYRLWQVTRGLDP